MMRITGGKVYGADLQFHDEDVMIEDALIQKVEPRHGSRGTRSDSRCGEGRGKEEGGAPFDASGCYVIPGLTDLHFHGALGLDVCDGTMEAYEKIAAYEASVGVTQICPATLTLSVGDLENALRTGAEFARRQTKERQKAGQSLDGPSETAKAADLVGFNMEGPFISPVKKGAQNPAYILPCSEEIVDRFLVASDGLVKIIGLAPEETPEENGEGIPRYVEYIRNVKDRIIVSLAHTNADYSAAKRAFDAGASHAVHLYNAMTGLTHREPGVVGAVSDSPHVTAELICDGIHIHPGAVRAAFRMIGAERMILISDSLRCAGMPDGIYDLGGQAVSKQGKYCRVVDGGQIAGSVSNLMDCMVNVVKTMDIPLETAVACAAVNPARKLGIYDRYGSIEKGKHANLVLLRQEDLSIKAVIKNGKVLR